MKIHRLTLAAHRATLVAGPLSFVRLFSAETSVRLTSQPAPGQPAVDTELLEGIGGQIPSSQAITLVSTIEQDIVLGTSNLTLDDNRINGQFHVQIRQGQGVRNRRHTISNNALIAPRDPLRLKLVLQNIGAQVVAIGGANAGIEGYRIQPGSEFVINRAAGAQLYAQTVLQGIEGEPTDSELIVWEELDVENLGVIDDTAIILSDGSALTTVDGEIIRQAVLPDGVMTLSDGSVLATTTSQPITLAELDHE